MLASCNKRDFYAVLTLLKLHKNPSCNLPASMNPKLKNLLKHLSFNVLLPLASIAIDTGYYQIPMSITTVLLFPTQLKPSDGSIKFVANLIEPSEGFN